MSPKIHALVEGLGHLARWEITGGQVHDVTQAPTWLCGLSPQAVIADKAFDSDALIDLIIKGGSAAVIPPKSNRRVQRDFERHQYQHRNLIERFFCRLKQFRRSATRYDKLASRWSSFIALAAAFIWLA